MCCRVFLSGSPFQFNVLDPGKVTVRGTGLDLVPVNEPASFVIVAPCAQIQDIDVVITGMCIDCRPVIECICSFLAYKNVATLLLWSF